MTAETSTAPALKPRVAEFATASRRLSWPLLLILLAFLLAFPVLVFRYRLHEHVRLVPEATGGLLNATLVVYLFSFAAVWLICCRFGGLKPADFGLDRSKIVHGAGLTLALWVTVNVIHLLKTLATDQPVRFNSIWYEYGVTSVLGALIGQLAGNALFEEMIYRHLLVTQLRAPWLRLLVALLAVQVLFAVMHIPNRVSKDVPLDALPGHLLTLFNMGLLFAWGYLQTRNIWFVVGWHSLSNKHTLLIETAHDPHKVLYGVVYVALLVHLFMIYLRRREQRKAAT